ncbi:MAG: DNA replication/repair protein RecF [Rickettsiaceae bacterium]|nr:MAG: DNA replication/repair protein RecF [Rickettsiaceae bacterium]
MNSICLQELKLENYRNFRSLKIEVPPSKNVIIIGDNGTGKTNILEAISLFSPGRGLRNAKFDEICNVEADRWHSEGLFHSKINDARISSQFNKNLAKRNLQFNGSKITNSELCKFLNIIWLTPQMENIFFESTSSRRKFFDKIVYNFYPEHAANIHKYEYYASERLHILQQKLPDERWLSVIESKIAVVSLNIAKLRQLVLDKMEISIRELVSEFPKSSLSIEGAVESMLNTDAEEDAVDQICYQLLNARIKDKFSGKTNFGVHRSDFLVSHQEKNKPAKLCSTGEQKAMLVSIVIAQINASIKAGDHAPIVLLDEIFVHLDDRRKEYLIDFLEQANLQFWMTATDFSGIERLKNISTEINTESLMHAV